MAQIEFIHYQLLYLLALLIPLGGLLLIFRRIRLSRLENFRDFFTDSTAARRRKPYEIIVPLLFSALLIAALARPFSGSRQIKVAGEGRDIMLVLDISRSMLAKDVSPSRLEVMKRKAQDLLKYVSKHSAGDRIGIVLFAGESYLYCPLTMDYSVVSYFIKSISQDLITSSGSAITHAISTALGSFRQVKAGNPRIILFSDGEDNALNVNDVINSARAAGIPVNVIGIGTEEGSPIEPGKGVFIKDNSGNIVISRLNKRSLIEIAGRTGGFFQKASVSDSDIEIVVGKRAPQKTEVLSTADLTDNPDGSKTITIYNELGPYMAFAALGILLLLLAAGKKEAVFSVIIAAACLSGKADAQEQKEEKRAESAAQEALSMPEDLNAAYHSYRNGRYAEALKTFEAYNKKHPEDLKVLQALASTYYKLGEMEAARKLFKNLDESAQTGRQKFESRYNLGNTDLMSGRYRQAIDSYEKALQIKPEDPMTTHNLSIAKRKLEEEQQKKEEDKQNEQEQEKEEEQEKKDNEEQKQDQEQDPKENREKENKEQEQQDNREQDQQQKDQPDQKPEDQKDPENNRNEENNQEKQQEQNGQNNEENRQEDGSEQEEKDNQQPEPGQTPSPEPPEAQNNGDQEEQNDPQDPRNDPARANQRQTPLTEQEMKESEAKAWLESLSDAPILYRRKLGRNQEGGQSW